MTILVMGHIQTAPGDAAKIKDLLAAHVVRVNAEEGCEYYSFAFDVADPDTIRIAERWTSPEALAAHGAAEHSKGVAKIVPERFE